MSYFEELLPEFRKGAKIRRKDWDKGYFVYFECGDIWNTDNELVSFSGDDLTYDSWEFYQEPIDWDSIIKNKCLCFFWDDYEDNVEIGTLKDYNSYNEEYIMNTGYNKAGTAYNHCRPIHKDEVTFYEDRKDER